MMAGMSRWPKFEKDGYIASKLRNLGTVIVGAHLLLHLPSAVHIYGCGGALQLSLSRNSLREMP